MNLFLIESPLQLLNAIEAQKCFGLNKTTCVLIILEGVSNYREMSNKQMKKLLDPTHWQSVYFVQGINGLMGWFLRLHRAISIGKKYSNIDAVFLGDYRSDLMRFFVAKFKPQEVFLLDDGNATLRIFEERKKKIIDSPKYRIGIIIKQLIIQYVFGINIQAAIIDKLNYFTVYQLPEANTERIVKNEYAYLKSFKPRLLCTDAVYFLGSDICEKNIIIDERQYFAYMDAIKKYYLHKKLVYIPHRSENINKLKRLENELGLTINRFETCIEYEISIAGIFPCIIASFYSSALENCTAVFGGLIDINAFYIYPDHLSPKYCDDVESIYNYYKNRGVEIIFLQL